MMFCVWFHWPIYSISICWIPDFSRFYHHRRDHIRIVVIVTNMLIGTIVMIYPFFLFKSQNQRNSIQDIIRYVQRRSSNFTRKKHRPWIHGKSPMKTISFGMHNAFLLIVTVSAITNGIFWHWKDRDTCILPDTVGHCEWYRMVSENVFEIFSRQRIYEKPYSNVIPALCLQLLGIVLMNIEFCLHTGQQLVMLTALNLMISVGRYYMSFFVGNILTFYNAIMPEYLRILVAFIKGPECRFSTLYGNIVIIAVCMDLMLVFCAYDLSLEHPLFMLIRLKSSPMFEM